MLGASEPIAQHGEEALILHVGWGIEIGGKSSHGFLVDLEEETVLAAEVLENRAFGDVQFGGDIADACRMVSLLGKMAHRRIDDAGSLCLGARARGNLVSVTRWTDHAAGNSAHWLTSSHGTIPKN